MGAWEKAWPRSRQLCHPGLSQVRPGTRSPQLYLTWEAIKRERAGLPVSTMTYMDGPQRMSFRVK